jgi:general L-amino acid transport system substrate-binding protein
MNQLFFPVAWSRLKTICLFIVLVAFSSTCSTKDETGTGVDTSSTLGTVKARGYLKCGVSRGLTGFSAQDSAGNWAGLDVDYCKAIALAIFQDSSKVEYSGLSPTERFEKLADGSVDVLARNSTWTQTRDTTLKILFAATNFYDGQAILVPASLNITSVDNLSSVAHQLNVCQVDGTTSKANLQDYFTEKGITPGGYQTSTTNTQALTDYEAGNCNLYTTDKTALISIRSGLNSPSSHVILNGLISEEPLSLAVREGDIQWFRVARWTHYVLLRAERHGVQSSSIDTFANSSNPEVLRLLGHTDTLGENLGLETSWAYHVIKGVGNYGEIYNRHLGPSTSFALSRGENALWTDGGLQFAPPYR